MECSAPDDTSVAEHSRVLLVPSASFQHVCSNTVLLSNGQVDQLILSVGLNKVQAFFELSSETTTKTITFLGISISTVSYTHLTLPTKLEV